MNRTQRKKFAIAVYFSVGVLAIVLAIIGLVYTQGTWRDLAINLATDLLGVVLLFFIVNQFFGLDAEGGMSERLETLLLKLERKQSVLTDSVEAHQRFPTQEIFASAHQVDMLGYSLSNLLYKYRKVLAQRVIDGAKVRVLIIDPDAQAHTVIKENSKYYTFESDIKLGLTHIRNIHDLIIGKGKKPKGSFEVRLTSWIPSCTLVIVDTNTNTGKMTVAINSPSNRTPEDRPYLVLEQPEHNRWFEYYAGQFDTLWTEARVWNPITTNPQLPVAASTKNEPDAG